MERTFNFEYINPISGKQASAKITSFIVGNDEESIREQAETLFHTRIADKETIIAFWEI